MSRTLNVVRMQLVNRNTYIWVPLMVLGGSLLLTLAIYALISQAGVQGPIYGGGAQAPLWYFGVVGIQALTLTFPFSQAMSVTRREFYLGTLLTAALASALLALTFVIGGAIELATDGWGMNGYFFALPFLWEGGAWTAALGYFTVAMAFFTIGFWAATLYKRFGSLVLTTVLLGISAAMVGVLFFIGRADAWGEVFGWFAAQGAVGLSLWGLLVIAALGGISYLTLRRATP